MKKLLLLPAFAFIAFGAKAQTPVTSLTENFNVCDTTDIDGSAPIGWTPYSVAGDQTWTCEASYGVSYGSPCIEINDYISGADHVNEDWLITPKLDLSGYTNPWFNFYAEYAFVGDSLHVYTSNNYAGSGDPTGATWTPLVLNNTFLNDTVFKPFAANVTSMKSAPFYIAFKYTSTDGDGSRWNIDSVFTSEGSVEAVANVSKGTLPLTVVGVSTTNQVSLAYTIQNQGEYAIDLYDVTGRKVYTQTVVSNAGKQNYIINNCHLTSGMYIAKVGNDNSYGVAKFTVQ